MKRFTFLSFFYIISTFCFAQVSAPKYSNEFLSIGIGARALGMSGTQVSMVNDVTSGYWNPAGLLQIKDKYEGSLMHAEYFAGSAKFDYAGFATPIDSISHLGVSIIRFGVDDIANTLNLYDADGTLNYNNITYFSSADYAFIFSYARKLKIIKGLRFGANMKIIHRVAGNFGSSWGFGFDLGAQLDRKNWKFGAAVRDVTGTFNAWSYNSVLLAQTFPKTGNTIPENSIELTLPKATLGVGRWVKINRNLGLIAGIDFDLTFDGRRNTIFRDVFKGQISMDAKAGMEINYKQLVFLRFGAGNVQKTKNFDSSYSTSFQPNFGVGFKISKFTIDYALTDIGDQSEALYSHVFSIKAGF